MPQIKTDTPTVRLKHMHKPVNEYLKKTDGKFSVLVRDALQAYLESDGPKNKKDWVAACEEFKKFRADFGRVGGNLNQVAFYFNTIGIVREDILAQIHKKLIQVFKNTSGTLKKIERNLRHY